jgi:membrane fusion protein, multidrug efflux system
VLRSPFILAAALLALLSSAACQSRNGSPAAAGPPPVMTMPVTTATASTQSAPLEVRVVGSVEPSAKVEVKSQVAGQLMSVHFTEGQNVSQAQVLLNIDPQPYRDALQQSQAMVERDRAMLNQAEVARQKDVVQSQSADADAKRFDALAKQRIVSEQQNLQYHTAAETFKQAIRADEAAIASARASLKVDESAVERAQLDLGYCEIRAPIAGRVGNLLVHAGNLVKVNDVPLVVINRISPVYVSFNAPEDRLEAIRRYSAQRQLAVEVTSRDDPGTRLTGNLSVIDNTVDTQTGTIHLKATFANPQSVLWPGQFVNVVLTLQSNGNATVIPAEAVQPGQKGQFVYVVKADKTVEPRIVTVGRTMGSKVIIENGVSPGETVVTDGQMMLFPGAHVSVVAAPKGDAAPKTGSGAM